MSIWNNPPVGFRIMKQDPVAVAACLAFVAWAWPALGEWSLIAPFVLGHFFLFCNVFRLARGTELIWAAAFVVNAVVWLELSPSLLGIVLTQLPVTIAVIGYTLRSPHYRGILADRLRRKAAVRSL